MDHTTSCSKVNRSRHKSNRERRLRTDRRENFPNGYLECWAQPEQHPSSVQQSDRPAVYSSRSKIHERSESELESQRLLAYTPVSIILVTKDNVMLSKENNYEIRFNTGVLEGTGITINDKGTLITFQDEGSYRFEICGEAVPFSNVNVTLAYHSDKFPPDIKPFSTISVPKSEEKLQLRGIPTILPLQENQTISTRLIPTPDESILLHGGTRLLIHRVA